MPRVPNPHAIRTYDQAVAYLYSLVNYERSPMPYRTNELKLDRMRALVDALDLSRPGFASVHVAGTKGKGSVCAMLASVLAQAGCRTGRFTSPHLRRIEERFWSDHGLADPDELAGLTRTVAGAARRVESATGDRPTYFEHLTAMAMVHFRRRRVRVAVFEVGLGGRLDSTNVITPVLSIISSISRDHVRQLGRTQREIAREKAGIVKPHIPTVCGVRHPSPRREIEAIAAERSSPLLRVGRDFAARYRSTRFVPGVGLRCALDYRYQNGPWEPWEVGLGGRHQADNAALVLTATRLLESQGIVLTPDAVRRGLLVPNWPARLEIVRTDPVVVVDCAHNLASIKASTDTCTEAWPDHTPVVVFGCSEDKDIGAMLRHLATWADRLILTRSDNPRAVSGAFLARRMPRRAECRTDVIEPCREALDAAVAGAGHRAIVLVTGSVFLAGDLREHRTG